MSRADIKSGMWEVLKTNFKESYNEAANPPPATLEDKVCNDVTSTAYIYSKLQNDAQSMRLVELLQGSRQDDISVKLHETKLDECKASYEALSYVWGDRGINTSIQVDEQTLQIGTNLRSALLNLRLVDRSRTFWIDAICINQNDTEECSQQVAIMGKIYRQAIQVVVWLRDQTEDTPKAFHTLEILANEALSLDEAGASTSNYNVGRRDLVHLSGMPVSASAEKQTETPDANRLFADDSVIHLVGGDWWHRAWTVQEILLASHAIVVAGKYTCEWNRFCVALNHGIRVGLWFPLTMGTILDPCAMPYFSLLSLERKRKSSLTQLFNAANLQTTEATQLLEALLSCRSRHAADPRDKVYAVLGLIGNPDRPDHSLVGIKPNYSSSVRKVYVSAAAQILLHSGVLDLLGASAQFTSEFGLPSWVPDWSITDIAVTPLMSDAVGTPIDTHATNRNILIPQFTDDDMTLILQGHEITTLVALATPLSRIQFDSNDISDRIDAESEKLNDSSSVLEYLVFAGTLMKMIASAYEALMSVVPHLGIFAEWERFASETPPTNPTESTKPDMNGKTKVNLKQRLHSSSAIGNLIHTASNLNVAVSHAAKHDNAMDQEDEPTDRLAIYWQTLCTGTYATSAPGESRKTVTQQLFYSWRASLKPISRLNRWHADRMLRPLGFVGYVRKTWRSYGEFSRFTGGAYERRLGRGANGYLCLVPALAREGDKVVLMKGGRVPLLMRRDDKSGYWNLIGEAYVHGIMNGEQWDEKKCSEFKIR